MEHPEIMIQVGQGGGLDQGGVRIEVILVKDERTGRMIPQIKLPE